MHSVSARQCFDDCAEHADKARRTRNLNPNAMCTFNSSTQPDEPAGGLYPIPDIVIPGRRPSRSPSARAGELPRSSIVEAAEVDFGQYVDEVSG